MKAQHIKKSTTKRGEHISMVLSKNQMKTGNFKTLKSYGLNEENKLTFIAAETDSGTTEEIYFPPFSSFRDARKNSIKIVFLGH